MTTYRHRSGVVVEVVTGDAWQIPADALVFGKSPELRSAIRTAAGKEFQPLDCMEVERPVQGLVSDSLPWRRAVSYPYTARNKSLDSLHVRHLTSDLTGVLHCLDRQFSRPRRTIILPLSWRRPEVLAVVTVAAVWQFIWMRKASRPAGPGAPWTFVLADHVDATVYLPILTNHNGCLGNLLKRWELIDDWTRQDFFTPKD